MPQKTPWSKDVSVLVEWPYISQIWPDGTMTPVEKANATARFVILLTALLRYLYPAQNSWYFGLVGLVLLYLTSYHIETYDYDKLITSTEKAVVEAEKPATKPEPPKPASEVVAERQEKAKELETKSKSAAKLKAEYIQNVFNDDVKTAIGFTRNSREQATRPGIVWSREQRIYSNRPFIRPSTDEYDELAYGDVGTYKFLSRRS